jgi:hypothetical protein
MAIDRNYVSETTKFLQGLLAEKPEIEEERRKGRSMWWDKKLDPEQQRRNAQSRIEQKGYVYFSGE